MAIIRVNIVTERARFCKVFTDEAQAIKETDAFLFENKLNDGCSLISCEDFIALNAVLADLFDDIYNADNFAQWEDIEKELLEYLQKKHHTSGPHAARNSEQGYITGEGYLHSLFAGYI